MAVLGRIQGAVGGHVFAPTRPFGTRVLARRFPSCSQAGTLRVTHLSGRTSNGNHDFQNMTAALDLAGIGREPCSPGGSTGSAALAAADCLLSLPEPRG